MRCPVCRQENESGRLFCAACAHELTPGAAAQVDPPRARGRRARQLTEVGLAACRAWDRVVGRLRALIPSWDQLARSAKRAGVILAALLPGLGHLLTGHRSRGWRFSVAFVAILPGLFFFGTGLGSLTILAILLLMLASVIDVSRTEAATGEREEVNWGHILLALAMVLGFYAAILSVFNIWWETAEMPVMVERLAPPASDSDGPSQPVALFERGDRILFRRTAYRDAAPERGDIVRSHGTLHRILGVPGDTLQIVRGRLYLNGLSLPARAYPIQAEQVYHFQSADGAWQLGEDQFAVWAFRYGGVGPMIVDREEIVSKAWSVIAPFRHRRTINHLNPTGSPDV